MQVTKDTEPLLMARRMFIANSIIIGTERKKKPTLFTLSIMDKLKLPKSKNGNQNNDESENSGKLIP